jgi:hypothetical protein
VVAWFSCGTASAVAAKLTIAKLATTHEVIVARCIVPEEHEDNDRFAADCAKWFGQPVLNLRSADYANCEDVWTKRRYMSGVVGAICTVEMKKVVRQQFEREFDPDMQAFGYTADEQRRVDRFRRSNPEVALYCPLVAAGLDKEACHAIVDRAGIELPAMYRLGFQNANCVGCVKAQSPAYWCRTKRLFPEVFARRAALSRELGVRLVKLPTGDRERIFLDELTDDMDQGEEEPMMECSLLCYIAEQDIRAPEPTHD